MDIDFSVAGRDRVINYVAEKYGRDRVAQIITFSTMAARAAIRDAGPRPRHPVRRRRPHREARSGRARADARGGAQARRRAAPGRRLRPGREGDHRPRAAARGADARRLDPRGGRRHRRAAAHRGRPAAAEGRRLGDGDAGRHARRRRPRPPEDGLPRAAEPRRHRQGGRPRRRRRHRHAPARRREDVRDARPRRLDRRVPVRVVGDARGAAPGEADRVRGPDRARRALPPRADGLHPDVRGAEERARAGLVRRPAARGDHRPDVRDLHLPGAVHADREGARRVLTRRGGDAAQGDRQEDPRAHGVPQGQVPRGLRREHRRAGGRAAALEGHGVLAGLLLQQGARCLLRAHRLPHGVAQGEPSEGVHGRAHLVGHEHEGPRARSTSTPAARWASTCSRRT